MVGDLCLCWSRRAAECLHPCKLDSPNVVLIEQEEFVSESPENIDPHALIMEVY